MSDFGWSPQLEGSWSSNHEPTESRVSIEGAEIVSSGEVALVAALPQESVDPEGGLWVGPWGGLLEDLEEDFLEGPERDFLSIFLQFEIQESYLGKLWSQYQILPDFKLEALLNTVRACNPHLGCLTLYREYFLAGLRLPLAPFFIKFFRDIGLPLVRSCWTHDSFSMVSQ